MKDEDLIGDSLKQLVHNYLKLLDARRAHTKRCPFPQEDEFEEAEQKLRDAVRMPDDPQKPVCYWNWCRKPAAFIAPDTGHYYCETHGRDRFGEDLDRLPPR